jgi:hypothetical protein
MQHRHAIYVHHGGKTVIAWWHTDETERFVCIESGGSRMETRLDGESPEVAATRLLRTIVTSPIDSGA